MRTKKSFFGITLGCFFSVVPMLNADSAEDFSLYQKAAKQGNANAQYNLGLMYHEGRGIAKNVAKAVAWYQKAADKGNADAQFNLGCMYGNGEGIARDEAEAVRWFRKAAKNGSENAKQLLQEIEAK